MDALREIPEIEDVVGLGRSGQKVGAHVARCREEQGRRHRKAVSNIVSENGGTGETLKPATKGFVSHSYIACLQTLTSWVGVRYDWIQ